MSESMTGKRKEISRLCEDFGAALLYLFGSQAEKGYAYIRGTRVQVEDPLADLDIGAVFRQQLPETGAVDLYADLYHALQEVFDIFRVDLVFLQEQHSVFQANAISGRCIYAGSPPFRDRYEEDILRRAADFKPFLERYLDEYLEEVLRDD